MNKMKQFLLLLGLALFPVNFLSAEVQYSSALPIVLEDFEKPDTWTVDFSPLRCPSWESAYGTEENTTTNNDTQATANNGVAKPADNTQVNTADSDQWIKWLTSDSVPASRQLTFIPLALQEANNNSGSQQNSTNTASTTPQNTDTSNSSANKTVMGVKGCWVKASYNWISISPKEPLYTPSYPVNISLYVWGNNFKYDLYLVVKNSEGTYHNLYLGNLGYFGWRQLKINFPSYVFPTNRHNSNNKLQIVSLKVMTNPNEDPKGFYTYFDNLIVQQSFSQNGIYDGSGLNEEKW